MNQHNKNWTIAVSTRSLANLLKINAIYHTIHITFFPTTWQGAAWAILKRRSEQTAESVIE